jgi:hypothetical protein
MRSSSNMTTSSYLKKNINMDSNVFEIIVNSTEIITKNPIVNIAKNRLVGRLVRILLLLQ